MAFNKRRKQPHLFRDATVHPTKQVKLHHAAQAVAAGSAPEVVEVDAHKRKPPRKRAKTSRK